MRVTCHQPHFLPWVPYMNKLAYSDLFIVLDDVAYRRSYYQNRSRIVDGDQRISWVTMPVRHATLGTPISEVEILENSPALEVSVNRLRHAYQRNLGDGFLAAILRVLESPPVSLLDLNLRLISMLLAELGIGVPRMVRISELVGKKQRSARLLSAFLEVGATRVMVGMGGMATAHDMSSWLAAGLSLDYQVPQVVPTASSVHFGRGISVVHDIMTVGSSRAAEIVERYWAPVR